MEPVTKNLPVIAMRGLNVFPRMNTSFDIERPISVHALERAMENGEEIFLVTQREIGVEQPEEKDLYEIGTVARVTQILRVSDRVLRVMMEGACRARLKRLWQREPFLQALKYFPQFAKGFAEKIADLLEHREAQQKKEREEAKRNPHRASARRQDDQDLER